MEEEQSVLQQGRRIRTKGGVALLFPYSFICLILHILHADSEFTGVNFHCSKHDNHVCSVYPQASDMLADG